MGTSELLIAVVGSGSAVLSAVAAVGSWKAAGRANGAAEAMKSIEAGRRWQELEPAITFDKLPTSVARTVKMVLRFDGPVALQRLESLTVRIRDDQPDRAVMGLSESGFGRPAEAVRAQVWGPFQFTPHVGPKVGGVQFRADEHGREVIVDAPLDVGEGMVFQIEPTRSPWPVPQGVSPKTHEADWRLMVGDKIRITVLAHAEGLEPWKLPFEVEAPVMDAP